MAKLPHDQKPGPKGGLVILALMILAGLSGVLFGTLSAFHSPDEVRGGLMLIAIGILILALPAYILFDRVKLRRSREAGHQHLQPLNLSDPSQNTGAESENVRGAGSESPGEQEPTARRTNFLVRHFTKGELVFMGLVVGIAVLYVSSNFVGSRHQRAAVATFNSLIETSTSTDPDRYFARVSEDFDQLDPTLTSFKWTDLGNLRVQKTSSGRFFLSVDGGFGHAAHPIFSKGSDLGVIGQDSSIHAISRIVWMCGSQIKNVEEIDVNLEASDGINTAIYEARLKPDSSFERSWNGFQDPELHSLVSSETEIVADTASGQHWIETTKGH